MSALALSHIPAKEKSQITIPVSELRTRDIIIDGMEFDEPVTIKSVFDPLHDVDIRVLTLANSKNSLYYREYSAQMEVVIKN